MSGIGKIAHLCSPRGPVMHAFIYATRTVPEWDCICSDPFSHDCRFITLR